MNTAFSIVEPEKTHPEQRQGERFIGNVRRNTPKDISEWGEVRLGVQAYDISGDPIDDPNLAPAFVPNTE